ncbi:MULTISPECIES: hypothetical protein [unclassified Epibacterium]|jgi:hypothetical protein|uniref:hypothetical protein n=1 Tax=unclassified Epibacterium TaxID=2639179 RepID=UPI001EF45E1E|nr:MULTISPECIES: hypothetical protein [unclassified Epibacterium]MCG7624552.1 hypothetical protein [Epibacterium sp. Ofav1-8]MCG7627804.1 hypothetical protein [Epibacterium sp. MM17-32]
MPELIKLYIRSALWGLVLAALFVGILLWFNVANLGALVFGSDAGVVAVLALWISNAVVFGGVQFGFKIMAMAERDETPRGGTPVGPALRPVLVPAKAAKPGRRA